MLPPGHVAAGYLVTCAVLKLANLPIAPAQNGRFLLLGMLIAFIPDIDMFVAFAKLGKFRAEPDQTDHRKYLSHVPILWFIAGLAIFFVANNQITKFFGILIWLASWSHFVLDSLDYGIMWLWPFNKKLYAIKNQGEKNTTPQDQSSFFGYWLEFIKLYIFKSQLTFYSEVVLIFAALLVYFF